MRTQMWALVSVMACVSPAARPEAKEPASAVIVDAGPPQPSLPPGCDADLSGLWVHREHPEFHYLLTDDGGSVAIEVTRVATPDAGPDFSRFRRDAGPPPPPPPAPKKKKTPDAGSPEPDAGTADAGGTAGPQVLAVGSLSRLTGLAGELRSSITLPSGASCEVPFVTRVRACGGPDAGGLHLETAIAREVSPTCDVADGGVQLRDEWLVRPQP